EALVVVVPLPGAEADRGRIEIVEAPAAPELFLVDPVAPFDLAVLLGVARLDVPIPDPEGLNGQGEGERKLLPVVALKLPDPEGKGAGRPRLRTRGSNSGAIDDRAARPEARAAVPEWRRAPGTRHQQGGESAHPGGRHRDGLVLVAVSAAQPPEQMVSGALR